MNDIRTIGIVDSRYFDINDILNLYGGKGLELANYLRNTARTYGRYANDQTVDEYLMMEAVDPSMTDTYDVETIQNWNQLIYYMRLYLLRAISSTPFYTGPYARETLYILPELLEINNLGVLSMDSEPGFYIEANTIGNPFVQLPYIQIGAPTSILNKIFFALAHFNLSPQGNRYLSLIDTSKTPTAQELWRTNTNFIRQSFPNMVITEEMNTIMLGVARPTNMEDMDDFLDYILTNKFFHDVRDLIESALGL